MADHKPCLRWKILVGSLLIVAAMAPSRLAIATDPGRTLFEHVWLANDPLAGGDGLGPMYNGHSCAECHYQGGVGGGGKSAQNVQLLTALPPKRPTVSFRSKLAKLHPLFFGTFGTNSSVMLHRRGTAPEYAPWRERFDRPGARASEKPVRRVRVSGLTFSIAERNSPALFGAGRIDRLSAGVLVQVAADQRQRSPDTAGRVPHAAFDVGRFGWRGQTASLREFVSLACAVELGLEVPEHSQERDPLNANASPPGFDLTSAQIDDLTAFVANLPEPIEAIPDDLVKRASAIAGKQVFRTVGCTNCHMENLGTIRGLYSDLLLHDLGSELEGPVPPNPDTPGVAFVRAGVNVPTEFAEFSRSFGQSFRTAPFNARQFNSGNIFNSYLGAVNELFAAPGATREWRTPPLWGVADSAPYLHDGRAPDLTTAIEMHDGQGRGARKRFEKLKQVEQTELLDFLNTLRASTN